MELVALVCAENASVDQQANRLSLFNVVDELSTLGFPAMGGNLAIVGLIKRKKSEPNEIDLRINVTINKTTLVDVPFSVSFQGKLKCRAIGNLQGLIIPSAGLLKITLMARGKAMGVWDIDVVRVGEAQVLAQAQPPLMQSAMAVPSAAPPQRAKAKKAKKRK